MDKHQKAEAILDGIRHRRAIFPAQYTDKPVDTGTIERLLELANWAPTHRRTEPWRFVVFHDKGLGRLSEYMIEFYDQNTPVEQQSELKRKKAGGNPLKSGAVIAIVMARDAEERVPEWEELAAVSASVQNMWIACSAMGLGSYWSTPRAALEAADFLGLKENERCLGLMYIGHYDGEWPEGVRGPVSEKVRWITE
jgi:nitroreductase